MFDLEVIEDPAAAARALDPIRARILANLTEPRSAAALAPLVGLTRQKVNYHLRVLERSGLARAAGERTWGGLKERLMVATASSYVVSPDALGPVASDPARTKDRLSASYLIALGARAVREVGKLLARARKTGKKLATLSIDAEIRFESPGARASFSKDLAKAVTRLAARYHQEEGRLHRLVVLAHPAGRSSS